MKQKIPVIYVRNPKTNQFVKFPTVNVAGYDDTEIREKISALEMGKQDKGDYLTQDVLNNIVDPIIDKNYSPKDFSGYGRINLPKNNGLLSQSLFPANKTNTIFVIQYDYDLRDQKIILPLNSVLLFNGGSLKNGILYGNRTGLVNNLTFYPYYKVKFEGSFLNFGSSGNRPNLSINEIYRDTEADKFYIKDLNSWRELQINDPSKKKYGVSRERPVGVEIGFRFFDTSLNNGKGLPIYWNGRVWIKADGTNAD